MLTQKEYLRQLLHLFSGLLTVLLIYFELFRPFTVFLLIIVGILASFICKRRRLPFFSSFLDLFERKENFAFPGRGLIFFFIGVLLVLQLFPRPIALASIMILALGDSISHIVGARYGETRNFFGDKRKLVEGSVAGFLVGFLGAWLFVPFVEAVLGSLIAMMAEVMQIDLNNRQVDDNLIVPLVAGTVMLLVRFYV